MDRAIKLFLQTTDAYKSWACTFMSIEKSRCWALAPVSFGLEASHYRDSISMKWNEVSSFCANSLHAWDDPDVWL